MSQAQLGHAVSQQPTVVKDAGKFAGASLLLAAMVGLAIFAVVVRYGVIQMVFSMLMEDVEIGGLRAVSWIVAPVLGETTRLSELYACVLAVGIILAETLTFHVVFRLATNVRQLRLIAAQQRNGVIEAPQGQINMARWNLHWRILMAAVGLPVLLAISGVMVYGEWHVAAIRCVLNVAQLEQDADLASMNPGGVILSYVPAVQQITHPEWFLPANEAATSDYGLLPTGIYVSAWGEVVALGLLPSLLLAIAIYLFDERRKELSRSMRLLATQGRDWSRRWWEDSSGSGDRDWDDEYADEYDDDDEEAARPGDDFLYSRPADRSDADPSQPRHDTPPWEQSIQDDEEARGPQLTWNDVGTRAFCSCGRVLRADEAEEHRCA